MGIRTLPSPVVEPSVNHSTSKIPCKISSPYRFFPTLHQFGSASNSRHASQRCNLQSPYFPSPETSIRRAERPVIDRRAYGRGEWCNKDCW